MVCPTIKGLLHECKYDCGCDNSFLGKAITILKFISGVAIGFGYGQKGIWESSMYTIIYLYKYHNLTQTASILNAEIFAHIRCILEYGKERI
jgi:hypothetical protein